MNRLLIACCVLALAGCKAPRAPQPDQCLRAQLFAQCMGMLPAGPVSTQYNDWGEVVEACQQASYYQSLRNPAHVKPECKHD